MARAFAVAADYVTDEHRATLLARGINDTFPEASQSVNIDATASGPIATVRKSGKPIFIPDVTNTTVPLRRAGLARKYGVTQLAWIPFEGGVLVSEQYMCEMCP